MPWRADDSWRQGLVVSQDSNGNPHMQGPAPSRLLVSSELMGHLNVAFDHTVNLAGHTYRVVEWFTLDRCFGLELIA